MNNDLNQHNNQHNSQHNKKNRLWVKQSLRLLDHEFRRGELTIIFLAIVLAVATVFSLSGFSNQIKQALVDSSSSYIAADRVLRTSRVIDENIITKANEFKLNQARKVETESMIFAGDNMLLSEINAVSRFYPLRGELKVNTTSKQEVPIQVNAPKEGELWVEPSVLTRLNINIGDYIEVGLAKLKVAGVLTDIPDRSYRAFIAGPSVILNQADLDKTQLVQPGSRLTYKYLYSGERKNIEDFEAWLKPQLNEAQRFYDAKAAQSRLSNTLGTAEKFLSLASMLGIILAAVAVAVASRRYGQKHQPMVAVFKALGASQKHIRNLYYLHWSLLSLLSIIVGLIVGYGLLSLGIVFIEKYLDMGNTTIGTHAFVVAIVTGLLCSVAFAYYPIKQLIATSPLSVIRGFSTDNKLKVGWHQLLPIIAVFLLLLLFSQDWIISASLLVGGLVVSFILLLLGQVIMGAGRSVGSQAGKSWHLALANLKRRASENSIQLVSFTIAIQLLLLIVVVKSSIIEDWQNQFPENTPNYYVLNINEQQLAGINTFVDENNIASEGFYQMVRGRLTAVNDELLLPPLSESEKEAKALELETTGVNEDDEEDKPRRRGVGRELGLTWSDVLPYENELVEGQWWEVGSTTPEVSIEATLAERLDIKLNDSLSFDIGGQKISAIVTNIRTVDWQNRQLNFYIIFNQSALKGFSSTYIAAWMLPEDAKVNLTEFAKQFPTVTLMDFGAILEQLFKVIDQVSIALQFILVLVVFGGSLVLVAQVQSSMEERERELAILRTLGAKGSLLRNSVLFEFVALGAIAGLMASLAMEFAVFLLQRELFSMPTSFHFSYWLLGIASGAIFVGLMGLLSCWRLLKMSSVDLIRRTF